MFQQSTDFDITRFNQIQDFKNVANKIINFISQFENELVKIWNKPRFALNSNIVVTIDRLKDKGFNIAKLKNHKNFKNQQKEWSDLGITENNELLENDYLPIDTKFFSEFKDEIEKLFNENEFDGLLIKSENYQALNTLRQKYNKKVKLIYIDPPYNTGGDGFIYMDNFNHSSWLCMMENRLNLAKEFLKDDGAIFVQCDDNEQAYLKALMDDIFGRDNFIANVIWLKGNAQNDAKTIQKNQEYILCYAKKIETSPIYKIDQEEKVDVFKDEKTGNFYYEGAGLTTGGDGGTLNARVNLGYSIYYNFEIGDFFALDDYDKELAAFSNDEDLIYKNDLNLMGKGYEPIRPPKKGDSLGCWTWSLDKFNKEKDSILIKSNLSVVKKEWVKKGAVKTDDEGNLYIILDKKSPPKSFVDCVGGGSGTIDLKNIFNKKVFKNPKPEKLLKRIIEISTKENDIVLDFFSGSGTTITTAQKLGRKYIGIEMGEHFYSVVIPRMKKTLCGFQSGISKSIDYKGGGIFKYYELEQYEQILRTTSYTDIPNEYLESKKAGEINDCFLFDEKFSQAIETKEDSFKVDLSKLYPNIDLKETIHNLTGKRPLEITHDKVIFEDRQCNLLEMLKRLLVW